MKFIISRYEHDIEWTKEYTDDIVVYDRSATPVSNAIVVPNTGANTSDYFRFIIDNYDNLPSIALYTKGNLWKYVDRQTGDNQIRTATGFTPLLSQQHKTYSDSRGVVCYYENGMYFERNDAWYLGAHPVRTPYNVQVLQSIMGISLDYIPFAPGANYIVPKENILKHPKELYQYLLNATLWATYPGESMIIERGLYALWR